MMKILLGGLLLSQTVALGNTLTCARLIPGTAALIEGQQGTPLSSRYTLVRHSANEYEALVNIEFHDEKGAANAKLQAKYEKKIQACYDLAAPRLRGPNGEYLRIGLSRHFPTLPQPEISPVRITKQMFFRSNSKNWESSPDCPLIVHETLHLLGLVDTYREKDYVNTVKVNGKSKSFLKYDCRSIGPKSSVMNNQDKAFNDAGLDWFSRYFTKKGRASLLFAGEYYAIVEPGCATRNAIYYACARNAYETSAAHHGHGCVGETPKECESQDWLSKFGPADAVEIAKNFE